MNGVGTLRSASPRHAVHGVDVWNSPISVSFSLGRGARGGIVKDNFDVAGLATTMGSNAFSHDTPAKRHAEVIDRLLAAGFRIDGRAKMHELAYGVTGINDWSGTPINPRWPDRIPGGSSSGSAAAVADQLVDFALGTDTGGSVRIPAACCGVIGFKPSFGRVSRKGVRPRTTSLDCVGVFGRNVTIVENVMAALDPAFVEAGPDDFKVGVVAVVADANVQQSFTCAIEESGCATRNVELSGLDAAFAAGLTIIGAEMWAEFGLDIDRLELVGDDVRTRLLAASRVTADDVELAEQVRARFRAEVDTLLGSVDVLALPTMPIVAPLLGEVGNADRMLQLTALVRPFNLSGHPAISLPIQTAGGLPAGLQLVGRMSEDARLCAIARKIETRVALPASERAGAQA